MLYCALVFRSRAHLNPDPLYVAGQIVAVRRSETDVEVTAEMKELASTLISLWTEIGHLRKTAKAMHAKALDEQRVEHLAWECTLEVQADEDKLPRLQTRSTSSVRFKEVQDRLSRSFRAYQERIAVPKDWKAHLPGASFFVAVACVPNHWIVLLSRT